MIRGIVVPQMCFGPSMAQTPGSGKMDGVVMGREVEIEPTHPPHKDESRGAEGCSRLGEAHGERHGPLTKRVVALNEYVQRTKGLCSEPVLGRVLRLQQEVDSPK